MSLLFSSSSSLSSSILLFIFFLVFFLPIVRAQFRFDDIIGGVGMGAASKIMGLEPGEQADPLKKVLGVWGRLLNRMSQQNPPSDDELHLKSAQETNEEGNTISEDPEGGSGRAISFSPKSGLFGGGSGKLGADRIIDEQRLNAILPRLNPSEDKQKKGSQKVEETATTTTTTAQQPQASTTSATSTTTTTATVGSTMTTTTAKKRNKSKKRKTIVIPQTSTATVIPTISMANATVNNPESSTTTLPKPKTTSSVPPMSILNSDEVSAEGQQYNTTKVGTTIRLRTGLNETVLARMENETAQLIAEIENVLADAELGNGAGAHWLKKDMSQEVAVNNTKMEEIKQEQHELKNNTTKTTKEEEESSEEWTGDNDAEEEESGEVAEDEVETAGTKGSNTTTVETTNTSSSNSTPTTTATAAATTTTTSTISTTVLEPTMKNKTKNGIQLPEAEEEEQQQQQQQAGNIAQLQLDATATVSAPTTTSGSTQAPQSAQNIFNLNSNANSYANPNFSNVMKPVNSIIDGIGPLILPLIGYSQRALDAYGPYAQRAAAAEGAPIFRPPAPMGGSVPAPSPVVPRPHQSPPTQQQFAAQQLIPLSTPSPATQPSPPSPKQLLSASTGVEAPRQVLSSVGDSVKQQQTSVPPPPSLALLGQIIEQRRVNERKGAPKAKEISGSSPPNAEESYFPPNLSNHPPPSAPEPVPKRPTSEQVKSTGVADADGRRTVQNTFHEDSGLMLVEQKSNQRSMTPADREIGKGFGNGRRPNSDFAH